MAGGDQKRLEIYFTRNRHHIVLQSFDRSTGTLVGHPSVPTVYAAGKVPHIAEIQSDRVFWRKLQVRTHQRSYVNRVRIRSVVILDAGDVIPRKLSVRISHHSTEYRFNHPREQLDFCRQ